MRKLLWLTLALGASCAADPVARDGEPAVCLEQTLTLPSVSGGWTTATDLFWACDAAGDQIALDPDTDDRNWIIGCFAVDAYAYRGQGPVGPVLGERIIVVEREASFAGARVDDCYTNGGAACFVGGTGPAPAILSCHDDYCAPSERTRCLYVHGEPPP